MIGKRKIGVTEKSENRQFMDVLGITPPPRQQIKEEHEIQKNCVMWFRLQYPQFSKLLFAIPNGAYKSKTAAGMMKAEGLTAGVADLCLAVPRGEYGALYIEMKQNGNYQQANQKEWQKHCEAGGNKYVVCKSIEEFMRAVNDYMRLGNTLDYLKGCALNYKTGHMEKDELVKSILLAFKL